MQLQNVHLQKLYLVICSFASGKTAFPAIFRRNDTLM